MSIRNCADFPAIVLNERRGPDNADGAVPSDVFQSMLAKPTPFYGGPAGLDDRKPAMRDGPFAMAHTKRRRRLAPIRSTRS